MLLLSLEDYFFAYLQILCLVLLECQRDALRSLGILCRESSHKERARLFLKFSPFCLIHSQPMKTSMLPKKKKKTNLLTFDIPVRLLKNLVETLKDLTEASNWEFSTAGWEIQTMDVTHVSLGQLQINASFLPNYKCTRSVVLGVQHTSIHNLLRTIDDDWKLTLSCKDELRLKFHAESQPIGAKVVDYELKLIDIKQDRMEIPEEDISDSIHLEMTSAELKECCRDLKLLGAQNVMLDYQPKEGLLWKYRADTGEGSILSTAWATSKEALEPPAEDDQQEEQDKSDTSTGPPFRFFSAVGKRLADKDSSSKKGSPSRKKIKTDKHHGVRVISCKEKVIPMEFSLLHLSLFSKAASLCDKLILRLESRKPLCTEWPLFDVHNVKAGHVRFFLAPKHEDTDDEEEQETYPSSPNAVKVLQEIKEPSSIKEARRPPDATQEDMDALIEQEILGDMGKDLLPAKIIEDSSSTLVPSEPSEM